MYAGLQLQQVHEGLGPKTMMHDNHNFAMARAAYVAMIGMLQAHTAAVLRERQIELRYSEQFV